ncbi:hypothetical protein GE09DRAFT_599761 [Coniochaeta sp. 2T2.1]|nr:hypothetical protein GE09DRAFT_599761 [Coniochaeta sp. 2T2.1]
MPDATSATTTRITVNALCEPDPSPERRALKCLDAAKQNATRAGTKRKADEVSAYLYICRQCGKHFSETDNCAISCWYHPGYLDVDDQADTWCDFYDGDGDWDTPEMKEDRPDGFKWDCCGTQGDGDAGCKRGPHVPKESYRKKSDMELEPDRLYGQRQRQS